MRLLTLNYALWRILTNIRAKAAEFHTLPELSYPSYIEIHEHYPSNHANSRHNKTNKARKLKFHVKDKYSPYQTFISTYNGLFWVFY